MSRTGQKVAIITGGSQGIGASLVAAYRRQGWGVVATARRMKPTEDPDVLTIDGDIAEPARRRTDSRRSTRTLRPHRHPDNDAGVFIAKPLTDYTAEDYALMVGVNLTGFFWLTQRVIAEMLTRGGGHVVNITTTLADYADSGVPSVLTSAHQGRPGVGHQVAGRRVRLPRHPGQRRLAGHHPDADAPGGQLRRTR